MPITRRTMLGSAAPLAASLALPRRARAAWPLRIGISSPVSGVAAESGRFQVAGARLAVAEVNARGGVLGRAVELVVEDDKTTDGGAVLAFNRLREDWTLVAIVGSIRSTQVTAIAPLVLKLGKPVMFGGTDPALTQQGNPWLFRCRPNDDYAAKAIAQFGVADLNTRRWAIVSSNDSAGSTSSRALLERLQALDVAPVLLQGYTNHQSDFTALAQAIGASGADILCSYFTYEADIGAFAQQLRQAGVTIPWIGSAVIVKLAALEIGGRSLFGTYGVADFAADASPAAKAFAAKFQAAMKTAPDGQSAYAYDATTILCRAIAAAGSTDAPAIRAAILAIRGFAGAEGDYSFDANGDGLHGYNIVRNANGAVVFDRHIDFAA